MTFGEWREKDRSTELLKEPKLSFAAWRENEYGGGSDPAPTAVTGATENRAPTAAQRSGCRGKEEEQRSAAKPRRRRG